jgi:hypothetical protein
MVLTKLKKKKHNSKSKTKKKTKRITMMDGGGHGMSITGNTTSRIYQLTQKKFNNLREAKIPNIINTIQSLRHPAEPIHKTEVIPNLPKIKKSFLTVQKQINKLPIPNLTLPFVKAATPFMKHHTPVYQHQRRPSYSKIHY